MDTGLYPPDQYKPGNDMKAFDWSGYDQDDLPLPVRQQMAKGQKPASRFRKASRPMKRTLKKRTP